MSTPEKIDVALIGFGLAGEIFHAPFIADSPYFNLVAVVSSRYEKLASQLPNVRVFNTVTELLDATRVELVVIATPNHTHYELASICLQHGKHVVMDKPWVLTTSQAEALIALARQKNRLICAYQNRRWDGPIIQLRTFMQQQVFGEIYQCEFHFDRYRPTVHKDRWKESEVAGTGVLYDLGSHLVDHALTCFGWPDAIWADVAMQRQETQINDYFHIVLEYGARRVILHAGSLILGQAPHIAVYGEQASYVCYSMDAQENTLRQQKNFPLINPTITGPAESVDALYTRDAENVKQTPLTILTGNYQHYYDQLYTALRGAAPPPVSYTDMLQNVRLLELAIQSAQQGQKIYLTTQVVA